MTAHWWSCRYQLLTLLEALEILFLAVHCLLSWRQTLYWTDRVTWMACFRATICINDRFKTYLFAVKTLAWKYNQFPKATKKKEVTTLKFFGALTAVFIRSKVAPFTDRCSNYFHQISKENKERVAEEQNLPYPIHSEKHNSSHILCFDHYEISLARKS